MAGGLACDEVVRVGPRMGALASLKAVNYCPDIYLWNVRRLVRTAQKENVLQLWALK
jgi:hypothetical protein